MSGRWMNINNGLKTGEKSTLLSALARQNRNYEGFSLNMLKTGTAPEGEKEATALLIGNLRPPS